MADIINPRAGGAQGDGFYGLTEDAATAAQLQMQIYALKQTLGGNKPGSKKYKEVLAQLNAVQAKANAITEKQKTTKETETNKKKTTDRERLVDKLQRAQDYGTQEEINKAKDALKSFDGKEVTVDTGVKPGEPMTTPLATSRPTTTGPVVVKPTTTGGKPAVTPAPAAGPDPKTSYINALREVIKSLPKADKAEVDNLLKQAQAGKWDEKAFNAALQNTNWWQSSLPSLQAYFIESHDPRNKGTFAEKMQIATDTVAANLEKLGITATQTDPITGKFYDNTKTIQGIAAMVMMNGWNDNQTLQHLSENAQLHFTGGGQIGSSVDNIKKQALLYGVNLDSNYINSIQTSLLDPTDGRDQQWFVNELKNQAMDTYKPFAQGIKDGRDLYSMTNNYRTKMAGLLETDASNISWKDLMGKVVDPATGNARVESEFIKQIKQDPLWQTTKNAKETYSNMALDLMKQFGFVG